MIINLTEAYEIIMAMAPSVAAVITSIVALLKLIKSFTDLKQDVNLNTTALDSKLKDTSALIAQVIQDNKALKKKIDRMIEEQTKVKGSD